VTDAPAAGGRGARRTTGVILVALGCAGLGGVGALAGVARPAFTRYRLEASRTECPGMVDALRIAELSRAKAEGGYVACASRAAAVARVGTEARDFGSDPDFACFRDHLGWGVGEIVHGAYWVEADAGGFTAHGVCDGDGDGVLAEYTADVGGTAVRRTGPEIY
jgi:hypothetical protein